MKRKSTIIVKKDGDWWIGWIKEVPGTNCQEKSKVELHKSLRKTMNEANEFKSKENPS